MAAKTKSEMKAKESLLKNSTMNNTSNQETAKFLKTVPTTNQSSPVRRDVLDIESREPDIEHRAPKRRKYDFTLEDINHHLYGRQNVQLVKTKKNRKRVDKSNGHRNNCTCEECHNSSTRRDPLDSLQKFVNGESDKTVHIKRSYAVMSFPDEVELCISSIPGGDYGVCAKQPIPVGTWIGPYEGKQVRPEDVANDSFIDTSRIWEFYENGRLMFYLDGSDEDNSSWMRFIRCARHKQEQNLYMFQFCGSIYYRVFREIMPGKELLVWYDEKYSQHMGISFGLDELPSRPMEEVRVKRSIIPYPPTHGPYPLTKPDLTETNRPHQPHNVPPRLIPYQENRSIIYDPGMANIQPNGHFVSYPASNSHAPVEFTVSSLPPPVLVPHKPLAPPQETQYYQHMANSIQAETRADISNAHEQQEITDTGTRKRDQNVGSKRDEEFNQFRRDLKMKMKQKQNKDHEVMQINNEKEMEKTQLKYQQTFEDKQPQICIQQASKQLVTSQHDFNQQACNPVQNTQREVEMQLLPLKYQQTFENKQQQTFEKQVMNQHGLNQQASELAQNLHREVEMQLSSVKKEIENYYSLEPGTMQIMPEEEHMLDTQESPVKPIAFNYPSPSSIVPGSEPNQTTILTGQRSLKREYVHDTPPQSPPDDKPYSYQDSGSRTVSDEEGVRQKCDSIDDSSVWKCGQCNKTFSQRVTLQLHICTHCPDKPYQCGHCFKSFAKPGGLKSHVITHTNDKPFKCGFCSRAFSGATTLNNHIRTHTGEKPFNCGKCGKYFSQATQLSRHQRIPTDCVC